MQNTLRKDPKDLKDSFTSFNKDVNNFFLNKEQDKENYYIIDKIKYINVNSNTNVGSKIINTDNSNNNNSLNNKADNSTAHFNVYNNLDYSKCEQELDISDNLHSPCTINTKINNNNFDSSSKTNNIMDIETNNKCSFKKESEYLDNKENISSDINKNIENDNNITSGNKNNNLVKNILNSPEYLNLQKENETLFEENISLKQELADTINKLNKIKTAELNNNSSNYNKNNNEIKKQIISLQQKLNEYENSLEKTKKQYEDQINIYTSQISVYNKYLKTVYIFFNNIKENIYPEFEFDYKKSNNNLYNNDEFIQKFKEIENYIYEINNQLNDYKSKYKQLKNRITYKNSSINKNKINTFKNLEQRVMMLEKKFEIKRNTNNYTKRINLNKNGDISEDILFQDDIIDQKIRPKSNIKIYKEYTRNRKVSSKKKKEGSKNKIADKSSDIKGCLSANSPVTARTSRKGKEKNDKSLKGKNKSNSNNNKK